MNRYLRLIAIDIGIFAFLMGVLVLGYGLWITPFYFQVYESGVNLLEFFTADSFLALLGLVLIIISVKMIANARKEHRNSRIQL